MRQRAYAASALFAGWWWGGPGTIFGPGMASAAPFPAVPRARTCGSSNDCLNAVVTGTVCIEQTLHDTEEIHMSWDREGGGGGNQRSASNVREYMAGGSSVGRLPSFSTRFATGCRRSPCRPTTASAASQRG